MRPRLLWTRIRGGRSAIDDRTTSHASYSPGLVSDLLLWLPLGFFALVREHRALPERSFRLGLLAEAVAHLGVPLIGLAFIVALASYLLTLHAMETAPVSYITAARQSSVLFAPLIAVVVLMERPRRLRVLGGIANVVGVVLIAQSR